jgi:chromate transport protein ChrA
MFNVAAFCGGVAFGAWGAVACWGAMMLPGTAMALGALPLWGQVRSNAAMDKALAGVNAAAAGLMAAAFIELWLSLIADHATASSGSSGSISPSSAGASAAAPSSAAGASGGLLLGTAHTRAAIVVALLALQFLGKQKGPVVILVGFCLGAANGVLEVEV